MKKVILIITAIVMVASGVAAVSAYEAHVVNVTAHVENAIKTSLAAGETTAFGTVFPQEWHKAHVTVELSGSAIIELDDSGAGDLNSVDITLFAEWKEVPVDGAGAPIQALAAYHEIGGVKYYPWLGEALWVGTGVGYDRPDDLLGLPDVADDATELAAYILAHATVDGIGYLTWVGPPHATALAKTTGHTFTLDASTTDILVGVGLDVPVFDGFYNEYTDPVPKPSWRDDPSWIIYSTDTEQYFPNGKNIAGDPAIMGIDLKFQVTDITRF